MLFVGIDLAWSPKNGSGIAVIKGDRKKAEMIHAGIALSDQEIVNTIIKKIGSRNAFVAIDAPLIVPNEQGRRTAEALVGSIFRSYDAGAHPANRKRLSQWSGKIRGEEISALLEQHGFSHDPSVKRFENSRKFFEVYPHPSMVVLFDLKRILRYKSKPKRDYEFRWNEFRQYQRHLEKLGEADPALLIPEDILSRDVTKLKSQSLKDYEDTLDSIFCAYIAYYCWAYPERCAVLGDMQQGYILTPVSANMKKQLESIRSQSRLAEF